MQLSKYDATHVRKCLEAICPIEHFAIVDEEDRKTWRVDFRPGTSEGDKRKIEKLLEDYTPPAPDKPKTVAELIEFLVKVKLLTKEQADAFKQA